MAGPAAEVERNERSNPHGGPVRLIYACTALLVLVLLTANAAVMLNLRESELEHEENQLRNLSLILAEQADRVFQSVDLVLTSISDKVTAENIVDEASFLQKMSDEDTHHLLQEKIVGVPQLDAVAVVSREGKLVNNSRAWPIPEMVVVDRDYFQALRDNPTLKRYIGAPVRNRSNGTWTIFLGHRVNGPDGAFLGLILGAIEMRYFEDFYRAIALGQGSSIALQRLDGVMLARIPTTAAIGKSFSSSEQLLTDGISGTVRALSPIDGQMRLKAAHRVANDPVLVLATKTETAALSNWRGIVKLMSIGALACAASIAAAGMAVARRWKQQAVLAATQAELARRQDRTAAFEAMRTAKEEAEMANRAKSEFLANMSHELRTPLNAVIGFSEIMMGEVFGPLGSQRYRDYAEDIHASGAHLLSIINDVLDLSKATAGKLELTESWIDARTIVEAVCRLLQPRLASAQLSLTIRKPAEPLMLHADERMLKQILLNLLSNACKFTRSGGQVECGVAVEAAGIVFAVSDTGIGIPAEQLDRVLQPFVQADSALSRRHEGTGLGLALVKAMAELHGGRLLLESEVDRGTTAKVILPPSRLQLGQSERVSEAVAEAVP